MNNLQPEIIFSIETYKDLFDNAHDLIHIVSLEGNLLYVNTAWEKILGYKEEEIKNRSIYSFITTEHRQRFKEYRDNIINGKIRDENIIVEMQSKNGEIVQLEGFVSVKTHDNIPVYTRGIFRDMTTRMKHEEKLKQLYEELKERQFNREQLLLHAPDAIIVIDASSIITHWNPKAEQIFGWMADEVLGKKLTNIIIPLQYRESHEKGMQRFLTTGEAKVLNKTIDLSALNKSGREFYISLTISTTKQKNETAFIAFIRDIDNQKKTELELEKKRIELEKSNQQLEEFAHVASHDMKEPVRKIMIFSQLLEAEAGSLLPEKQQATIRKINRAASRLKKMVDGLLSYSSINETTNVIEEVNLSEIIKRIEQELELLIAEKKASIRYRELPKIQGSGFLIHQLFYNLVINALKFSKPGLPPVISIESVDEVIDIPGAQMKIYKISVCDNGIGFNQQDAEKIFGKFIRLHTTNNYEGTGIGLPLCRKIAERHGGSIEAKGKEGEGACMIVRLPERQGDIN